MTIDKIGEIIKFFGGDIPPGNIEGGCNFFEDPENLYTIFLIPVFY